MKYFALLLVLLFSSGCCRHWLLTDCDDQYYVRPAIVVESDCELTDPQKHMVKFANPGTVVIFRVRPRVIVIPEGAMK